ncbi:N-acetylglucosamine kinase of eukaryotic type [[Actinomadura] parvosata subsp. kistnae]|uniref:BadF/BadG/BcrA/BcrD ATPase family protein n=1 Tax=[Actinomadura] parvosata TaxID=1955412 RepID=UPI000D272DA4|nr:N-acetylglucosamine kinase of eukaryotic type [Actinomadura parvosata subsp. kistnae]
MTLFAGVDAGGTTTRAAVHAADGTRLGYGVAGPGNPAARGAAAAGTAIERALRDALDGLDPSLVAGSVAGVAGADEHFAGTLRQVWAACGLTAPPRLVGDVDVAYAAGTPAPSGTVLLAGTGAAAARFARHAVTDVADGLGWLLGDEGGGFWIGRAGIREAVRALDRGLTSGPLVELVSAHFAVTGAPRRRADRVVRLAQAEPTVVAAAAPLVTEAAAAGDPAPPASSPKRPAAWPPRRTGCTGKGRSCWRAAS